MQSGKWGLAAGCAAIALVTVVVGNFAYEFIQRGRVMGAGSVEQVLDSDPLFKTLNQAFPDEHASLSSVLVQRARSGATEEQLGSVGFRFMRDFTVRHAPDVAAAPTAELREYASTQAGFIRALRDQDPALCAGFAFTGLGKETQLGAEAERAMRKGVEAQIRAARAGRDQPVAREKPDRADMEALAAAIVRKGVRSDRVDALIEGSWSRLSTADQCDLGVGLYEAISSLPAERSAKVTAHLTEVSAQVLRRS